MIKPVTAETLQNAISSNESMEEKFNLNTLGFVQDAYGNVHYGFVVNNLDEVLSLYATNYQATAFDKSNKVIGAASGTIPLTFPNEKMGVTGSLSVPEGGRVARLEIAIDQQSADGFELPVSNPLTSDRVTFIPSTLQPRVTGIVRNSLDKDIQYVPLDVIAYDRDGKIIGVGDGLISSVPAEGNAAADVFIYAADQPDRLELYPQITNPMEMGWF